LKRRAGRKTTGNAWKVKIPKRERRVKKQGWFHFIRVCRNGVRGGTGLVYMGKGRSQRGRKEKIL